jgi:hypothetical protein
MMNANQPVNRSDVIEVNGVQFQTEIQSVVSIPVLPFVKKTVRLGIRVTNRTSNRLYFARLSSLDLPAITDSTGEIIEPDSDILRLRVKGESYYSILPEESSFFPLESFLVRILFNLKLKIYSEAGGFYCFSNIKRGNYRIQLLYRGRNQELSLSPAEYSYGETWVGKAKMPFVDFYVGRQIFT